MVLLAPALMVFTEACVVLVTGTDTSRLVVWPALLFPELFNTPVVVPDGVDDSAREIGCGSPGI